MIRKARYLIYIPLCLFIFPSHTIEKAQVAGPGSDQAACRKIIGEMLDSIKNVKSLRYNLYSIERIEDKYLTAMSELKVNVHPRKVYFKNPAKKLEVLWKQGWNDNLARIKLNFFPYLTLNLDTYGPMMRKEQHHTLHELGYAHIGNMIATSILKDPKHLEKYFSYKGIINWNGHHCHVIENNYPGFGYFEYTAGKNETVSGIAFKFGVGDYMLRYKNDLSSYYGTLKEGKKIQVPNNYSSKTVFYIDKYKMLPINIKVYDDKGLYEGYEFLNLVVNSPIPDQEFSENYKGYNF